MSDFDPTRRQAFRPYFTMSYYLFGNSLLAFCVQLVMSVVALALIYAGARLMMWLP